MTKIAIVTSDLNMTIQILQSQQSLLASVFKSSKRGYSTLLIIDAKLYQ